MNFYGLTRKELEDYFSSLKVNIFKAKFLMRAAYSQSIDTVEGISADLLMRIKNDMSFEQLTVIEKREDDTACKYLLRLSDGNTVETVRMKEPYGDAVCVSTQVGCNMGCAFCESGRQKKIRNLSASEITLQVMAVLSDCENGIYSVSVMGIGEPFDNFIEVMKFTDIITDQYGLAIPPRHVTVSTAGLIPQIDALAESDSKINLAVSLHAPNDGLRSSLMPINRKYSLKELIESITRFSEKKNRRVTVEYIMLKGINDRVEDAEELAELLKGIKCYVNIIPYNETENIGFKTSEHSRVMKFYDVLKKNGIRVTMRRKMGESVNAACGQLRSIHNSAKKE